MKLFPMLLLSKDLVFFKSITVLLLILRILPYLLANAAVEDSSPPIIYQRLTQKSSIIANQ